MGPIPMQGRGIRDVHIGVPRGQKGGTGPYMSLCVLYSSLRVYRAVAQRPERMVWDHVDVGSNPTRSILVLWRERLVHHVVSVEYAGSSPVGTASGDGVASSIGACEAPGAGCKSLSPDSRRCVALRGTHQRYGTELTRKGGVYTLPVQG